MTALARVLCVDDEQRVLDGLAAALHGRFEVATAASGPAGLTLVQEGGRFAVVMADMRMPGMDGATLLRRVRETTPDTVRMLLTGHTELDVAIQAVNEGQIFRFLTKPCPVPTLRQCMQAAVEQYELIQAKHELLEQTLRGAVRALSEVLALANPPGFGRARRLSKLVGALIDATGTKDRWSIDVAAMLSHLGSVALPEDTAERVYLGKELTPRDQEMLAREPRVTDDLLASIPRLDPVREILRYRHKHFDGSGSPADGVRGEHLPLGARMLHLAVDYDQLLARGLDVGTTLATLRGRSGTYDPALVDKLGAIVGREHAAAPEVLELPLRQISEGMTFAEDVRSATGTLLIARGHEVTSGLVERIRNLADTTRVVEPVRVHPRTISRHA